MAKLQHKALCRLNTRLQQEFTRENIWEAGGACVEKQRKFGKVKGYLRNFGKVKGYLVKFSQGELLMMRSAIFSHHE